MKHSKFIIILFATTGVILSFFTVVNIAIDPLYQYHKPWFGFQPIIMKKRYQIAGIAKNFDIENAVIGNSLAENIRQTDLDMALGGKVIRLTAEGSHPLDWCLILDILQKRKLAPRKLMFNLDPFIFRGSPTKMKHEWPLYLYDRNPFNDIQYLWNFDITWKMTYKMLKENRNSRIPSPDAGYVRDESVQHGREFIMKRTQRQSIADIPPNDATYITNALENIKLLIPYFKAMPQTEFIFFCSPFSILYWDSCKRDLTFNACRESYRQVFECLLKYANVNVFFWDDVEMLQAICNLDYYADSAHFNTPIGHLICERIRDGNGCITLDNLQAKLQGFFVYLDAFDYDSFWQKER